MPKTAADTDADLRALQVPSHSLPNETGSSGAIKASTADASSPPVKRVRTSSTLLPKGRGARAYQAHLADIERRRGREMRRTLRTAEAAQQKQQCRNIAVTALVVMALGLSYFLLASRSS